MFKMATPGNEEQRQKEIFALLQEHYPETSTRLRFQSPFQLLVAALLSARTTDAQVNRVTEKLFACAGTPEAMAALKPEDLEPLLQGCGLYRHKSRYLVELSRLLLERHGGEVPGRLADLLALPGVGRKTANVVLSNAFAVPALAVDTHVFRVARRLGLAAGVRAERVEQELMDILPSGEWSPVHYRLIAHGRNLCTARRPRCGRCFLSRLCPHGKNGQTAVN